MELVEHVEGILLRPVAKRHELKTLLKGVKPGNLHTTIETGPPAGREAW